MANFFSVTVKFDGICFFAWLSMFSQMQLRLLVDHLTGGTLCSRTFPFSLCVHVKHSLGSRASYGFTLRAVPAIGELDFHVQITLLVLLFCSVLWSVCKTQVRLVMQMAAAVLLVIANAQ